MNQTKRGTDRLDPYARLGWGERLGYGISSFGTICLFIPITSFLLIYLTNVACLDIAAVSAIIAVSKVLDGISDLVIGRIIDRTRSRLGKGRVWLLRMCLPFAAATLLLFWVPASLPSAVKYIYVFILYNLVSTVFFTFMTVSGHSLIQLMTINRKEQGMLGCIQAIFSSLGVLLVGSCFVKLLNAFSGSADTPQTQRGYTMTITILCGIMVASALITVASTRERVTSDVPGEDSESAEKVPLRTVARALLGSKYWVFIFVITLASTLLAQFCASSSTYYANYVLHDLDAVGWMTFSQMLPTIPVQLAALFLMKKLGKTRLYRWGLLLTAAGSFSLVLSAPSQAGMMASNMVRGLGLGLMDATMLGLLADTILYTSRQSGIYSAGLGNAGISASQKIGAGLATALFGFLMKAVGFDVAYDLQQLPQPVAVEHAATWAYSLIPGIGNMILFLLFVCFYHLDQEMGETAGGTEEISQT